MLPEDISAQELSATMRGFALGLGLRCSNCHVGEAINGVRVKCQSKPLAPQKNHISLLWHFTLTPLILFQCQRTVLGNIPKVSERVIKNRIAQFGEKLLEFRMVLAPDALLPEGGGWPGAPVQDH